MRTILLTSAAALGLAFASVDNANAGGVSFYVGSQYPTAYGYGSPYGGMYSPGYGYNGIYSGGCQNSVSPYGWQGQSNVGYVPYGMSFGYSQGPRWHQSGYHGHNHHHHCH